MFFFSNHPLWKCWQPLWVWDVRALRSHAGDFCSLYLIPALWLARAQRQKGKALKPGSSELGFQCTAVGVSLSNSLSFPHLLKAKTYAWLKSPSQSCCQFISMLPKWSFFICDPWQGELAAFPYTMGMCREKESNQHLILLSSCVNSLHLLASVSCLSLTWDYGSSYQST